MKKILSILSFIFCVLSVFLCGCSYNEPRDITYSSIEAENPDSPISEADNMMAETIYVSVVGEIANPGVYIIPSKTRVYELINEAGGTTDNADLTNINMVDCLTDGMQLYIPTKALTGVDDTSFVALTNSVPQSSAGKININTASVEELTAISGIGKSRAGAIVAYREKNGAFKNIEAIMNVSGIKEKTFENIKDKICVN